MTLQEALTALEKLGNPTTKKHNTKNGAPANQYGVPMGDIRKLAAKIKTDHDLGLELWATGNVDAQFLAILIMKPTQLSAKELEKLVKTISFAHVADWMNSYIVKNHTDKEALRVKWLKDKNIWAQRSAWSLTSGRINSSPEGLDLEAMLDHLEKSMPKAKPEVQWTMNYCLAGIGINHPKHRKRALEIGETLGIYRDYPCSKGCTSPFAPIWINEMVKRQKAGKK